MKRMSWLVIAGAGLMLGFFASAALREGGQLPIPDWLGKLARPQGGGLSSSAPPPRGNDTIRVASFNIQVFGEAKLADEEAMRSIASILQNFDLVAIQEVRAVSQEVLPRLVERLNAGGKYQYDYALGPRLGRSSSKEQYAFVFDMATIEIDRNKLYTVDDRDDLLHRPPLVGWFRARGPGPEQAFTFSLATIHTDPEEADLELDVLDDVFYAVRDDPARREDDVILLGDFNARGDGLRQLGQVPGLVRVVTGSTPTNTLQTAQYDNILFHGAATSEFTGRGGVYDFLRGFNLSQQQAERISDHLPVWAEFSVFEGGRHGPIAARPAGGAGR
jgi:endonuclease/exonuclease/phosphatase family metal-dependent hydrolase